MALPLENGGVKLLTTDQSAHTTQHECSAMLGVDFAHCQVENMLVGGGFGGKEDMSVQHHAALIAYIARVPVKVKLTRQESLLVHPKRHPMWMDFTMGCDENGIIQGVKASVVSDTGGFASLGGPCSSARARTPRARITMRILKSRATPTIRTIRPRARSAASV